MDRIWILGSSGWMPANGRETSCVAVEMEETLVVLDAGTGISNLALIPEVLARHTRVNILLSHYHLDHTAGLMYLKRFMSDTDVSVYGPGRPIYPKSTHQYAHDLLQHALYSSGADGFARSVNYHDYGGSDFTVDGIMVQVTRQHHSAPSFRFRLNDTLIYATDTDFRSEAWAEVEPTHVLLHECWQLDPTDPRHTALSDLVTGLRRERFDRVVLIHQNPSWDECDRAQIQQGAQAASIELAFDSMCLEVDTTSHQRPNDNLS